MSSTMQANLQNVESNRVSMYKLRLNPEKKKKNNIAHTSVYSRNGRIHKINKKEKKISYNENEPMNDTHVMKEQHKEEVESKW